MCPFNVIIKADVFKMFFNMGECNINIPFKKKRNESNLYRMMPVRSNTKWFMYLPRILHNVRRVSWNCLQLHNWKPRYFWTALRSDQISRSLVSDSLRPHELQHARPPCPSSTPRVHSDSCPSSQWCHPAISSSVVPFSSCRQSLPASEALPMSQLFAWGGQSTGVSALASFLPKKSQGWSPSQWTGWKSLQSKGLSRVFSNTTVQKHQFFSPQLSSQSNSHIHTWPLEKL